MFRDKINLAHTLTLSSIWGAETIVKQIFYICLKYAKSLLDIHNYVKQSDQITYISLVFQ